MVRPLPVLLALALPLSLAACARPQPSTVRVVVVGAPDSLYPPARALSAAGMSPAAQVLRAATAEGLIALDSEGRVAPALAERWIIADDGQSYIFRLRDGAWRDATPLSAESVRYALSRAFAAQRGTPLGLDLAVVRDVRAMAARVIEIRLHRPMPDFLQLLAQPELGLVAQGGGAGPLAMRREEGLARLTAIPPDQRGLPMPDGWAPGRPIAVMARPASAGVADFVARRADLVLGGRYTDFPGPQSRLTPQFDPVSGLFGLIVDNEDGVLATPEMREAIAMAIDRPALGALLGLSEWAVVSHVLPTGAEGHPGGERWATLDLAARRKLAGQSIAAWVKATPGRLPLLRLALPDGHGADVLARQITADLAQIGLRVERVGEHDPADARLLDAVARYPSPAWVFHQLACAVRRPCSPEADTLANQAEQAAAAQAPALYAQAEAEQEKANIFIPLGLPLRWSLVAPGLPGFQTNRWAVHPLAALPSK